MSKIVIVGAGFAGVWSALSAARALDKAGKTDGSVEVIVIAPEPILHIRPRFYESDLTPVSPSVKDLFEAVGVRFIQGFVKRIDVHSKSIEYTSDVGGIASIQYDRLVLACGSSVVKPESVSGLQEHAFTVDNISDAKKLDAHLHALASLPDTPARNTVVVAGGGFTGIEGVTEMPARLRSILGDKTDVHAVVIDRNGAIGPELGPGPRPVIEKALKALGVTVYTGDGVASIDADGVTTSSGRRIEAKTVVWTAGVRANPISRQIDGATLDAFGRLIVDEDLRVKGVEGVFATGDMAHAAADDEGHVAMMSCQHAINLGRSSGHNVASDLLGLPTLPYQQAVYVTCLDLGAWGAVVTKGWDRQVAIEGPAAKEVKILINAQLIYPPADRLSAFEAANPKMTYVDTGKGPIAGVDLFVV